ncbi:hypothetical protein [Aliivibrio fischeri]|uniref:hypothetical protein n=1 Tax=Aliivibrio fischeri TaxID=668 RepID=UPI00080E8316|nr:hypothetical protein [Aliivibrio fischeri]OCH02945.1 hypothetical protein A6E11_03770 [Aliivibrio fischeri]
MNKKLVSISIELATLCMYQMQLTVGLAAYSDMNEETLDNLNYLLKSFSGKEQKDDRNNIIKWLIKYTNLNYSTKKKKLHRTEKQNKWNLFAGLHDELFISANTASEYSKKFDFLSIDDLLKVMNKVTSKIEHLEKKQEFLGKNDPFYNQFKRNLDSNDTGINGFKWPSTLAYESSGNIPEVDWPQVGMLKGVGYSVGAKGLPTTERRELLSNVMSQQLPYVTSYAYRREWGEPNTTARLKKLANTIASFAKNSKRSPNNTSIAISEWEDDLKWLKENYYKNRKYSWSWPS